MSEEFLELIIAELQKLICPNVQYKIKTDYLLSTISEHKLTIQLRFSCYETELVFGRIAVNTELLDLYFNIPFAVTHLGMYQRTPEELIKCGIQPTYTKLYELGNPSSFDIEKVAIEINQRLIDLYTAGVIATCPEQLKLRRSQLTVSNVDEN